MDGAQYADGRVEHQISIYDASDKELSGAHARQLAAALIDLVTDADKMAGYDQITMS